jgi:hypothetical protein
MEGFIKIRRGLREHVRDGRMTAGELSIYIWLHFCADFRTGSQKNSAPHIHYAIGRTLSVRQIRRYLESLESKGYIKRFMVPGKKGDYYILINKFEVTDGDREGQFLNTDKTMDWREPVYDGGCEDDRGNDRGHGLDDSLDDDRDEGRDDGPFVKKYRKNSRKKSKKNSGEKGERSGAERPPTPPNILTDEEALNYLNGDMHEE